MKNGIEFEEKYLLWIHSSPPGCWCVLYILQPLKWLSIIKKSLRD